MSTKTNLIDDFLPETNDALLLQSLELYTSILAHYTKLQGTVSTATKETSQNFSESLAQLFLEVRNIDNELETRLKKTSVIPDSTGRLLRKRSALLDTLVKMNTSIADQAKNIKSLLRHEISGMSTNRRAIQGYTPVFSGKNIVKNSY